MVLGCKRIHISGRKFSGFLRIVMELCGSKVQLAPLHGILINGIANSETIYCRCGVFSYFSSKSYKNHLNSKGFLKVCNFFGYFFECRFFNTIEIEENALTELRVFSWKNDIILNYQWNTNEVLLFILLTTFISYWRETNAILSSRSYKIQKNLLCC